MCDRDSVVARVSAAVSATALGCWPAPLRCGNCVAAVGAGADLSPALDYRDPAADPATVACGTSSRTRVWTLHRTLAGVVLGLDQGTAGEPGGLDLCGLSPLCHRAPFAPLVAVVLAAVAAADAGRCLCRAADYRSAVQSL